MPAALVINPNTTQWMTEAVARSAAKAFHSPWEFRALNPPGGPTSIESWLDTQLAATAMLALVRDHSDVDGVVIACFGDPGLFALRELLDVPVVGIAEAAFLTACMLGLKFGVLVGEHKDAPSLENVLWTYGLEKRCAGLEAIGVPILDLASDRRATLRALTVTSRNLRAAGAESLLLGCAGLSDYQRELGQAVGLPVIDPVEAGCRQLQVLVGMGLSTSRAGIFARSAPKELSNLADVLNPELAHWLQDGARRGFQAKEHDGAPDG
jgi:allantoin racemase